MSKNNLELIPSGNEEINTNSNNSNGNIEQAKETQYTNQQNFINFILNLYSENLRLSSSVGKSIFIILFQKKYLTWECSVCLFVFYTV